MLSKNKLKQLRAYHQKKNRDADKLFIVEGNKLLQEVLDSGHSIICIVCTSEWFANNSIDSSIECIVTHKEEIAKISLLITAPEVWALVSIKKEHSFLDTTGLIIALDGIQDPGNMGTILRVADWYGIKTIVCSTTTVDAYNPKVVQASMGAILRMNVIYVDLCDFLSETQHPIYGAFLEGENIYKIALPKNAIVVMGNEGAGVSVEVSKLIQNKIHIPKANGSKAESLNVAVATSIICSEFFRR